MKINSSIQKLDSIVSRHPVIRQFLDYVEIPSPTVQIDHLQANEMRKNIELIRKVIADSFRELSGKIKTEVDSTGTLIIRVPPSKRHTGKQPLAFLGHMDIVPGDLNDPLRVIHPVLKSCQTSNGKVEVIASDGTTTLGADNKAGLAITWDVVKHLLEKKIPHTGIEIVISPDEEGDFQSLIDMDTSVLLAKDVVNVDGSKIFNIVYGCSSYVEAVVSISGLRGGHSGDRIHERTSVLTVLKDVLETIGNGVISFNPAFPGQPLISKNVYKSELADTPSNAIPTSATIRFSLRSYSHKEQNQELERIKQELKKVESRFKASGEGQLQIKFETKEDCPPWEGDPDSHIANVAKSAAIDLGHPDVEVQPMHATTQANVMANKTNQYDDKFSPIVIGPNIDGEHTTGEMVEWRSMLMASEWWLKIVEMYSNSSN